MSALAALCTCSMRMHTEALRAQGCVMGSKEGKHCRLSVTSCLQALEEMQAAGHRPDAGVLNCAVEALAASGVLAAQLKAAQLFQAGVRAGPLRPQPQGKADLACIAFTAGTAQLALLQWLADLRRALLPTPS